MNRNNWQDREGHPPADLLLLHIEGELEGSDSGEVSLHLNDCEKCREKCDHLGRGMASFTAFRDSVVLPKSHPRTAELKKLLLASQTRSTQASVIARLREFFRIDSPKRIAFAFGCGAVCLAIWLVFFPATPRQSVYASQILENARYSSDSLAAQSKVLRQRIRLQRGNIVIERSIRHGRHVSEDREPKIDAQFQQALSLAHIDLNDPLNANDFAAWRSAQGKHTDRVKETAQSVTVTTEVRGAEITESTLTLSSAGWRPIARSVEFHGEAPIEISEESFDISDLSSLASTPDSSPSGASVAIASPALAPGVSASELEESELGLREAFHTIGADVSAAPEIWTSENRVLFKANPENPGQMKAIEKVADRIPHVQEAGEQPRQIATANQPAPAGTTSTAAPPLASALEGELGSAEAAGDFLNSLRGNYKAAIAEATALDQLGKRYPVDVIKTLPPPLRTRVNTLAASLLSSLQHDSASYVKSLAPILDDIAKQQKVTASSSDAGNLPNCLHWQDNAALAVPQLSTLNKNVSFLFDQTQAEKPVSQTTSDMIANSLSARAFLERHLMSTCQLFGSN
jgi:hypothetical protein